MNLKRRVKLYANIVKIVFKSFIWTIRNRKEIVKNNEQYSDILISMKQDLNIKKNTNDKQHMERMLNIKLDLEKDLSDIDKRFFEDLKNIGETNAS